MSALPPESGHVQRNSACPLCANSGHLIVHSIRSLASATNNGGEAKRLGFCRVKEEIELGRLPNRKSVRLRPAQNLVAITVYRRCVAVS
jgi:hypothetical protein